MTVCIHKRSFTLTNAFVVGVGIYVVLSGIIVWIWVDNSVIKQSMGLYICGILFPLQLLCCIATHFLWKRELKRMKEITK